MRRDPLRLRAGGERDPLRLRAAARDPHPARDPPFSLHARSRATLPQIGEGEEGIGFALQMQRGRSIPSPRRPGAARVAGGHSLPPPRFVATLHLHDTEIVLPQFGERQSRRRQIGGRREAPGHGEGNRAQRMRREGRTSAPRHSAGRHRTWYASTPTTGLRRRRPVNNHEPSVAARTTGVRRAWCEAPGHRAEVQRRPGCRPVRARARVRARPLRLAVQPDVVRHARRSPEVAACRSQLPSERRLCGRTVGVLFAEASLADRERRDRYAHALLDPLEHVERSTSLRAASGNCAKPSRTARRWAGAGRRAMTSACMRAARCAGPVPARGERAAHRVGRRTSGATPSVRQRDAPCGRNVPWSASAVEAQCHDLAVVRFREVPTVPSRRADGG